MTPPTVLQNWFGPMCRGPLVCFGSQMVLPAGFMTLRAAGPEACQSMELGKSMFPDPDRSILGPNNIKNIDLEPGRPGTHSKTNFVQKYGMIRYLTGQCVYMCVWMCIIYIYIYIYIYGVGGMGGALLNKSCFWNVSRLAHWRQGRPKNEIGHALRNHMYI